MSKNYNQQSTKGQMPQVLGSSGAANDDQG